MAASTSSIANLNQIAEEKRLSESRSLPPGTDARRGGVPAFQWSHLWKPPIVSQRQVSVTVENFLMHIQINPLNRKSYTLPIFNLSNPYSRSFYLSWRMFQYHSTLRRRNQITYIFSSVGFFVAFLSWFAFPPLIPDAIKSDLKLSQVEIANSNIVALVATLAVRFLSGPLVDRYGPRKVMAGRQIIYLDLVKIENPKGLLILGAIPSGLAGTVHNAQTLYAIRFFIGILGGTFIPCQAWTSCFFDKNIVGTANAFVAGWGNMGYVLFYIVCDARVDLLTGEVPHSQSWSLHILACDPTDYPSAQLGELHSPPYRMSLSAHKALDHDVGLAFRVPILLSVAVLTLVFGQDHPAGAWSQRHTLPATAIAIAHGHHVHIDLDKKQELKDKHALEEGDVQVSSIEADENFADITSTVDFAVNQPLTLKTGIAILASPLTWLPALAYLTTFGLVRFRKNG